MEVNIVDMLNDIRRASKTYVTHKDFQVKPIGNGKFILHKKLKQQIEKEVMVKIRKKNPDAICVVNPTDNKLNFMCNRNCAIEICLYDENEKLYVYVIYDYSRDIILYYVEDSGLYLQKNNRIEVLTMSKIPSALGVVDEEVLSSSMLVSTVDKSPQRKKCFKLTCSGSILLDIIDLCLGKIACLFIGAVGFRNSETLAILKKLDYNLVSLNGVLIVTNPNAQDITVEEEELDDESVF